MRLWKPADNFWLQELAVQAKFPAPQCHSTPHCWIRFEPAKIPGNGVSHCLVTAQQPGSTLELCHHSSKFSSNNATDADEAVGFRTQPRVVRSFFICHAGCPRSALQGVGCPLGLIGSGHAAQVFHSPSSSWKGNLRALLSHVGPPTHVRFRRPPLYSPVCGEQPTRLLGSPLRWQR